MIYAILFLLLGFIMLIKGADLLVDGASSLARKYGISYLVIGLTVVSFGTSAPELFVNISSSLQGNNELVMGNILGSNIANIFLILGISSLIYDLRIRHSTVWRAIPFAFLSMLVGGILINDNLIDRSVPSALSRLDGIILLFFFTIFMSYTYSIREETYYIDDKNIKTSSPSYSVVMILIGIIGLAWGGQIVVDQAINIAQLLNVSDTLIGLTIVAIGTSLPELAASAVAAYKKNADIAVGNIVGSNIFNTLWVLGFSSIIHNIKAPVAINIDIFIVLVATILLFFFYLLARSIFSKDGKELALWDYI